MKKRLEINYHLKKKIQIMFLYRIVKQNLYDLMMIQKMTQMMVLYKTIVE